MRVLLTGAGGFIGGAVLRRLLADGTEVVTLGRAAHAPIDGVAHHRLDLLAADREAMEQVAAAAGCERLIHAAWYTNHADYLVAGINRDWLAASTRLFSAFRAAGGGRIVALGTCIEYALGSERRTEDRTPLAPDTLYGECKKTLSERLLALPDTAWARVFFVYGPGDRAGRLVPQLVDRARAGAPVAVRHGGLRRDYVHIDDLAAQIAALAASDLTGAVNVGSGHAVRLSAIAEAAAAAAGRPDLAEPNDLVDPGQPPVIEADMARYRAGVGPVPSRPLDQGLVSLFGSDIQDPASTR